MITLIVAARRRPGMSQKDFVSYWTYKHAPLVLSIPEYARHVRKYVIYPVAGVGGGTIPALGIATDYDGVGELWFDDHAVMMTAFSEPRYLEVIRPDEDVFLDRDACLTFVTQEHIMKDSLRN